MNRVTNANELLLEVENFDVQKIFNTFNSLYFDDKLNGLQVRWSYKMSLCAGQFQWGKKGLTHGAEIVLSEPLLKMRPKSDTLNTLVHEMIHAFLHITDQRDNDAHGKLFTHWMNLLNDAEKTDITIYHTFHDEVDYYRQHVWACDKCGNIIKRAMNRDPNTPIGPQDAQFYAHKQICETGSYVKIHAPEKSLFAKKDKKKAIPEIKGQKKVDSFFTKKEVKKDVKEGCPICGIHVENLENHVNKCLDDQVQPVPSSKKRKSEVIDLTEEIDSKRIKLDDTDTIVIE
jgi:rubrerythrin